MTEGKKENVGVTLSIFVLVNRTVIKCRGLGIEFPLASTNMDPGYFHSKTEEK